MPDQTSRFLFPLLASGQAQKEVTHNEALTMIDALISTIVQSVAPANLPVAPMPGQCWIVGLGPTGAWTGQANAIACWTAGGWRFMPAQAGLSAWSVADGMLVRFDGIDWIKGLENASSYQVNGLSVVGARQSAIAGPSGGANIDSESRVAIGAILTALRAHGLITT